MKNLSEQGTAAIKGRLASWGGNSTQGINAQPVVDAQSRMPEELESQHIPETPENETLGEFLDRFRKALPMSEPLLVSDMLANREIREALGLNLSGMLCLMKGVRVEEGADEELINSFTQPGGEQYYDDLRMDALAAIAWSMKQAIKRPYYYRHAADWQAIARRAKEELEVLGNPAAEHIHVREEIPGEIQVSPMAEAILADIQAARPTSSPINESSIFVRFYEAIVDERFRDRLGKIDEIIERINTWPLHVDDTLVDQFPAALRRRAGFSFKKRVESARRVITFTESEMNLERDELRAFLLFYYSYDEWATMPLQTRVDKLRKALGKHPLADLINDPTPAVKKAAEEELTPAVGNTDATSGVIFNESRARRTIDNIQQRGLTNLTGMDKGVAAALAGKRQPEETPKAPPSTPPKKPTEAPPPPPLLTKEKAMKLLEGMPRTRWRELSAYLHSKSDSWGDPIDFRKLQDWIFPAIQLAVRAQLISSIDRTIEEFDSQLPGITFEQATGAVDTLLSGTLSDPRAMSFDGKRLYEFVDVMEQLARNKNRV